MKERFNERSIDMNGFVEMKGEVKGGILLLKMKGRFDTISSPVAERAIFEYINNGHNKIVFDFFGVNYLSSAGMRSLLSIAKKLKTLSGKLVICNINDNVMDVLKMSGFDRVLELSQTEDDALRKF